MGRTVALNLHVQEALFPGVMLPVESGIAGEGEVVVTQYGVE
jgi:hypothetical protein